MRLQRRRPRTIATVIFTGHHAPPSFSMRRRLHRRTAPPIPSPISTRGSMPPLIFSARLLQPDLQLNSMVTGSATVHSNLHRRPRQLGLQATTTALAPISTGLQTT